MACDATEHGACGGSSRKRTGRHGSSLARWVPVLVPVVLGIGCSRPEDPGVTVVREALTSPSYVQGSYAVPQTPQSTVNVTFSGAQTAGNLNVVVVGWSDTTAQ